MGHSVWPTEDHVQYVNKYAIKINLFDHDLLPNVPKRHLKASWGFVYNSWLISANFCETEIAERSRINANCLVFRYFWYFLLYILAARVKQKQDSRYKLSIINRPYIKFIFDALGVSDFDAALDWSLSKMDKCPWSNLIYNILEIYLS